MKKKILMMLLVTNQLFSQIITLDNAIERAIERSEEIIISEKDLNISKKNLNSAFKTALPNLFLTGIYLKTERPLFDINPVIPVKFPNKGHIGFLGISQPIFKGGSIMAGIKGAKAVEIQQTLKYLQAKRDMRMEVIAIYSGILEAKNRIEAYTISKEQLTEALNYERERFQKGKSTKSDILKAEYQLLEIEADIIEAQNQVDVGLISLKQKLNLSVETFIEVEEFFISKDLLQYVDYENDLKQALENSIASNLTKTIIEKADAAKMSARSELLPHVDGFIGKASVTEEDDTNNSWGGGVVVNWNIFQFGKDYDKYEAANLGVEKAKSEQKLTKDNIRVSVRKAYLDIIKLNKIEEVTRKALEEAEENYQRDKVKYQRGMISFIDFLISQEALTSSRVKYINSKLELFYAFEKYRSLLI